MQASDADYYIVRIHQTGERAQRSRQSTRACPSLKRSGGHVGACFLKLVASFIKDWLCLLGPRETLHEIVEIPFVLCFVHFCLIGSSSNSKQGQPAETGGGWGGFPASFFFFFECPCVFAIIPHVFRQFAKQNLELELLAAHLKRSQLRVHLLWAKTWRTPFKPEPALLTDGSGLPRYSRGGGVGRAGTEQQAALCTDSTV